MRRAVWRVLAALVAVAGSCVGVGGVVLAVLGT